MTYRSTIALVFFATAGAAALGHEGFEPGPSYPWYHDEGTPVPLGDVLVGDVTSDGVPDAVVMEGDGLVVLSGPARYEAFYPFGDASAAAIARDFDPSQGGQLFVSAGGELRRAIWQDMTTGFSLTTETGPWSRSAALAGSSRLPILLVHDELTSYAYMMDVESTGVSVRGIIDFEKTPGRIALVDVDGSGDPLAAAVVSDRLTLRDRQGDEVFGLPRANQASDPAGDLLAVFDVPGTTEEALVWVRQDSSTTRSLCVIFQGAVVVDLDLGTLDPISIAGASSLGGPTDLLLGFGEVGHFIVLHNSAASSSGFAYSLNQGAYTEHGSAAGAPSTAGTAFHDLDHDGDADALMFNSSTGDVTVRLGSEVDATDQQLGIPSPDDALILPYGPWFYVEFDYTAAFAPPAGATGIEMLVWRRDDVSSPVVTVAAPLAQWPAPPEPHWTDTFGHLFNFEGSYNYYLEMRYFREAPGEARVAYVGTFAGISSTTVTGVSTGVGPPQVGDGLTVPLPPPRFPIPPTTP